MRAPLVVVLVLAVAACGGGDDDVTAPTTTTTAPKTTTTAVASTTTTTDAAPATLEPLDIGISIHVEGFDDVKPAVYARHLEAVERVASEAQAAGITITFELSKQFAAGAAAASDGWVAGLPGRGQAVGAHADVGGKPTPRQQTARQLAAQKRDIEALLGAPITHVSGVCSSGPWVEPVIDAGFRVATAMVEFCLKSLDTIPPSYDVARIEACSTPSDCHGQAPTDLEHKLHPWHTSTSADWLTDDPSGSLRLVAGESGITIACLAEGGEGHCTPNADDIPIFAGIVRDYVATREPGRTNSLVLAWSIGSPPPAGFVTALAASVADQPLRWRSVADLGS